MAQALDAAAGSMPSGRQQPEEEWYRAARSRRICRPVSPLWAGIWLVVTLAAQPVKAQSGAASKRAVEVRTDRRAVLETARGDFRRAMEHYTAGRFREAIAAFQRSLGAISNPDLHYNIARAYEQLGEPAAAIDHYSEYLRGRPDAADAADVQSRMASLREQQAATSTLGDSRPAGGELALDAAEEGALVHLDGAPLGRGPFDKLLMLEPGVHELTADKPGFVPLRAAVEVRPGGLSAAYVDLEPLRGSEAHGDDSRTWTWIVAGASTAALLLGVGSAVLASNAEDRGAARDWDEVSNVALGSAIVLALGSVVLFFEEPSRATAGSRAPGPASFDAPASIGVYSPPRSRDMSQARGGPGPLR
jgi:tetratricopeptide (TPR) repeat protein